MKPPHVILTVLATVVIFASGVVTGGLLVRRTHPPPPPPQPGWPMARFDQFQRAVDTLDLPPEKRRKVLGIIHERQAYVADMMRVIEPDLPGLFAGLREDINKELTDGQKHDLDEIWNRIQQRRLGNRPGEAFARPGDLPPPPDRRRPPPRFFRPPPDRLPPDRLPPPALAPQTNQPPPVPQ